MPDFHNHRVRKSFHPAEPLERCHMPTDMAISLQNYTGNRTVRIPDDFGPSQSLTGFDPDYRNIIDYIVRITFRIWETDNREVEYIGGCYSPDSLVYDDYGLQIGNQKIVADTYHTTGAFPDIILDAEEVIWAGNESVGFHTSHLCRIIGTNTAPSRYGQATGRRVSVPAIANCVSRENDIYLEHVVYNTSAMLSQLGIDLWQEAERLAANPPAGWPRNTQVWNDLRSAVSPRRPLSHLEPTTGFDPDAFARETHTSVWNETALAIDSSYAAGFHFKGTTNRSFSGRTAYKAYVQEIRNAFPDLKLQVDEVYWMGNCDDGWRVSTRWSAEGMHDGGTLFREPTGRPCQLWGITQWRIEDGEITHEWQLFNEFDVMMQIANMRKSRG